MRGLARAAMRGPVAASLIIAAFALLALVFAPALFVSGGLLSLVTLRHGALQGLKVVALASAVTAGAILFVNGRLGTGEIVQQIQSLIPISGPPDPFLMRGVTNSMEGDRCPVLAE